MGDPRWYSQGKVIAAWGMLGLAVMANAIRAGEPGNTSRDAVEGAVPGQRPGPGDSKRSTQVKVEGAAMPGAKLRLKVENAGSAGSHYLWFQTEGPPVEMKGAPSRS